MNTARLARLERAANIRAAGTFDEAEAVALLDCITEAELAAWAAGDPPAGDPGDAAPHPTAWPLRWRSPARPRQRRMPHNGPHLPPVSSPAPPP